MNGLYKIGLNLKDSPQTERRVIMLNKVTLFFLILGLPVAIYILLEPNLPIGYNIFIVTLWLSYFSPFILNSRGWLNASGYFLYFAGLIATSSAVVLIGKDSYAHFLVLLISGLPFVFFNRDYGNKRLLLAFISFPVWICLEIWCYNNPPLIDLKQWQLYSIGVLYSFGILMFSIFISYNFTKSAERYGAKIKKQRDALTEKNARLEQYSYMATHDLKTPIANIEGFISLLEMDLEEPNDDVLDSIHGLKLSCEQSRKTITELIEMASQRASDQEMVRVKVEPILKEVLFNLRNVINETKADVKYDFSTTSEINFNIAGTKSLLQNLLSNAIKYRHPERQPQVILNTKMQKGKVQLMVKDNGLGIDMEKDGDKLFSKFERIHTNAEGSGLGLSLIKSMVEENGGTIDVNSELGKGSEFIISLPIIK